MVCATLWFGGYRWSCGTEGALCLGILGASVIADQQGEAIMIQPGLTVPRKVLSHMPKSL